MPAIADFQQQRLFVILERKVENKPGKRSDCRFSQRARDHLHFDLTALQRGIHGLFGRALELIGVKAHRRAAEPGSGVAHVIHIGQDRQALRHNLRHLERLDHAGLLHADDAIGSAVQLIGKIDGVDLGGAVIYSKRSESTVRPIGDLEAAAEGMERFSTRVELKTIESKKTGHSWSVGKFSKPVEVDSAAEPF